MTGVVAIMAEQPEVAKKQLAEMAALVGGLKADSPAAVRQITLAKSYATTYTKRVEILQTPLADIEQKLAANADDTEALSQYVQKMSLEISALMSSNPDEAVKKVEAYKAGLAKVNENAKEAATKTQVTNATRAIAALERRIDSAKKMAELIGKDAAPLKVETWVNGSPLTDDDLKGKVVLLDFWAIWCGPCIATFPHLREWNEKYGEKGLVMIGLTRYYEYDWNAETKKAGRVPGTTHEKEQEMLVKFAESYGLKHRFGIQADNSVSEFYGVTGIPHVVVIDQQGKVRLMKVGSGEANANAISAMLDELLGAKAGG
jgi:thiol-disulfide isomerase/thioredoxin